MFDHLMNVLHIKLFEAFNACVELLFLKVELGIVSLIPDLGIGFIDKPCPGTLRLNRKLFVERDVCPEIHGYFLTNDLGIELFRCFDIINDD